MAVDWLMGKSPKMWINEICVKQLRQAKWETREAIPGQQPPTFICRCLITYSDMVLEVEGTGKTKKEAEQEAALEMLKNKLGMTPAKLLELNNQSKKKSGSSFSSSASFVSGSSSVSSTTASLSQVGGDDGGVSDTDNTELNEAVVNPISELNSICEQNEFEEPEYKEVSDEGPPHKKIFTISCTLKDLGVSFSGRRNTKKIAKRLAAFRVLREIKKRGLKFTPFAEISNGNPQIGATSAGGEVESEKSGVIQCHGEVLERKMENLSLELQLAESVRRVAGRRDYCDDQTQNCLQFCVDYGHAFEHLKKSETLDVILASNELNAEDKFGGATCTLELIAKETGIKLCTIVDDVKTDLLPQSLVFVKLRFPFDFKHKLPVNAVVFGLASTEGAARNIAAKKAVELLRSYFIRTID